MKTGISPRSIAKIAVLSALASIVMMFDIPLFFAPAFYKIDLSEVVVLIGGFAISPAAAVWIEGIKVLLNAIVHGTTTNYIGELANFIIGVSFVLPASIVYLRHKSRKHAMLGLAAGTVSMTIIGCLMNYYVLLPVFSVAFQTPLSSFIAAGTALNANITDLWSFILLATAPFNLIKGILTSVLVMLLYKRIAILLKK